MTRRRRAVSWILALSITGAGLYIAMRGIDLRTAWRTVLGVHWGLFAISILWFACTLLARAARLRTLLEPQRDIGFQPALAATSIGMFANNFLPFRAGDVTRLALIRRSHHVPLASMVGAALVERILDLGVLVLFVGLFLLRAGPGSGTGYLRALGSLVLVAVPAATLILFIVYRWRGPIVVQASALLGRISGPLAARIGSILERLSLGLRTFRGARDVLRATGWSLVLWSCSALSYLFMAHAFGFRLDFLQSAAVVFVTVLGVALPSAPGYVGTFHGFCRLGLEAVGITSATLAASYATVLHFSEWVIYNLAGGAFLLASRSMYLLREGREWLPEPTSGDAVDVLATDGP